jgi:CysZ protein
VVSFEPVQGGQPRNARTPAGAALGFFAGARALFGGLGFVVTTPSAWGWAMIPVTVAALLFGATGTAAILEGSVLARRLVGESGSAWSTVGVGLLEVLFGAVGLVLGFVVAMSLAQPLAGFALDAVARKQELALGGRTYPAQPVLAGAVRALRVSLTALAIGLPILGALALLTFVVPPLGIVTVPLKFVVTGLLAAYDLLDYPLSQRGCSVADRLAFMRRNFVAVLGFGVATAAVLLVPGAGLLLLPFGVAGATRLVMAAERAGQATRAAA